MDKKTVYVETSIIGYLTSRPSRDLITAGHQTLTRDWWDEHRQAFHLFISGLVIGEVSQGDQTAAEDRLSIIESIDLLEITMEVDNLMDALLGAHALPIQAKQDAAHVATASVHHMDYLLTWNCKHIANAQKRSVIENVCQEQGYRSPIICTPEELLGEYNDVERSDS